MGIYRGPGGTGDAVNDASSEALITVQAKDAALAAQAAAEAAQAAAELAETNAETAETNAETAETNAETAATNAANSASAASTSATNAASSASAASTSASNASTSASNAASSASAASTSASNASTSATNASNSASTATTQATNASNSASAAATSETNASNSAALAQDWATKTTGTVNGSEYSAKYYAQQAATFDPNLYLSKAGNLSGLANTATARTNLGVAIGTDVQAYDAQLADIAGLTPTDNNFIVGNGTNFVTESGSTARTSLGLGSIATQDANNVAVTGGSINGTTVGASTASSGAFTTLSTTGDVTIADKIVHSGDTNTAVRFPAADTVTVETSGAERLRVDSSGNVGIGTSSPADKVGIYGDSVDKVAMYVENNNAAGSAGADKRLNLIMGGSSAFGISGWQNAGVVEGTSTGGLWLGAYNGDIKFGAASSARTERMRIDSSGNVGIGITNPATKLVVKGTHQSGQGIINIIADSGTRYSTLSFTNNTTQKGIVFHDNTDSMLDVYGAAGQGLRFTTNDAERMRIDSSGNVGIGTSSPAANLHVQSSQASMNLRSTGTGSPYIDFYTGSTSIVGNIYGINGGGMAIGTSGGTERMRITSGGTILVGKTASSATTVGVEIAGTGGVITAASASTNSASNYDLYSTGAAAYRFYVGLGGTIYATSTTITAISDVRLKENIQDIDAGLDAVMALKPRKFDWKAGKGKDKKGDRGWIAQEFEQVFPDMIDEWKDPAPAGEEPYKSVNADLIPVLVKAIQEQQAIINELKTRIETLENK